jgi:hypothetical protein
MDMRHEFMTNHQEQMIAQARINLEIRSVTKGQAGLQGLIFDRLGEAMIAMGTWLKKKSNAPIINNSVKFYSQN